MKQCKQCDEIKTLDNFTISKTRISSSYCKPCAATRSREWYDNKNKKERKILINRAVQWRKNNPVAHKKMTNKYQMKEGVGVYQVMLDNICLYVGEGMIKSRKYHHLKSITKATSAVLVYCLKHNINRELLSFNVLEHETDTVRRKQIEDWYITFLNPVINPTPPLGIYV